MTMRSWSCRRRCRSCCSFFFFAAAASLVGFASVPPCTALWKVSRSERSSLHDLSTDLASQRRRSDTVTRHPDHLRERSMWRHLISTGKFLCAVLVCWDGFALRPQPGPPRPCPNSPAWRCRCPSITSRGKRSDLLGLRLLVFQRRTETAVFQLCDSCPRGGAGAGAWRERRAAPPASRRPLWRTLRWEDDSDGYDE